MEETCSLNLCSIIGTNKLTSKNFVRLEDRWRHLPDLELEEHVTYHFGQNVFTNEVPQAAEMLIKRDYKKIYDFSSDSESVGLTIVPESFIPVCPNIQSLDRRLMEMSLYHECAEGDEETHMQYEKDFAKTVGDMAERDVYDFLKEFYSNNNDKTVLVIKGLEMMHADQSQRRKHGRQMDFIIVDYDSARIINVEVKNTLTAKTLQKVKKQLQENKAYFEDWFTCDISAKWSFTSAVYVNNLRPELESQCPECWKYLLVGKGKLKAAFESIYNSSKWKQMYVPEEDFRLLAKYLLFCSPALPLPIGEVLEKEVKRAMNIQGTEQNIRIWCFPNPEQKMAMQGSHVLFMSAYGTGKTLLMTSKAKQLAVNGQKVLYLLFLNGEKYSISSLLYLNMMAEMNKYKNIKLCQVRFVNDEENLLQELTKDYKHIMVDEFFDDFPALSQRSQREVKRAFKGKETLWMALSNSYFSGTDNTIYSRDENLTKRVKEWFPDLHIVTMKIPLRSPRFVTEHMKSTLDNRIDWDYNCTLLARTELPPTLTDGVRADVAMKQTDSLSNILGKCLERISKHSVGIIIVADHMDRLLNKEVKCQCKKKYMKILFDEAFKNLRKDPPLYWTETTRSPEKSRNGLGIEIIF